ncbi:hypothetical protein R1flu_011239 [Riccia fluitans]|uniref:Uncharacterized protein n=1 Tax=Riccia fluitans TaxID=41844 RepID=A0ABD1ZBF5_9MARC
MEAWREVVTVPHSAGFGRSTFIEGLHSRLRASLQLTLLDMNSSLKSKSKWGGYRGWHGSNLNTRTRTRDGIDTQQQPGELILGYLNVDSNQRPMRWLNPCDCFRCRSPTLTQRE